VASEGIDSDGGEKIVNYLLDMGADPCVDDNYLYHVSIEEDKLDITRRLLNHECIRKHPTLLKNLPEELKDEIQKQIIETGRIMLDVPGFDPWVVEEMLHRSYATGAINLEEMRRILMNMGQEHAKIKSKRK